MNVLILIQIIISVLLCTAILLQSKGVGLGKAWGGEATFYHTKRGIEKFLFIFTIILTLLFFGLSIFSFLSQ